MSSRAFRKLTNDSQQMLPCEPEFDELDKPPAGNTFSALSLLTESTGEVINLTEASDSDVPCTAKPRKKRKHKKKYTKKQMDSDKCADLKESSVKSCIASPSNSNSSTVVSTLDQLLLVNRKSLDPLSELRQIFGSNVIGNLSNQQRLQNQSRAKHGLLVRIKPSWPPLARFGFNMTILSSGIYTFVHNREYRDFQKAFYVALDSMDPNSLMSILAECPYHIDSLLQLSDLFMHQDNSETGSDLLERVLHAYQSSFHPRFNPLIGTCRLDYKHEENRGLFVALFRYISFIGSKGCYRNALDYCKILFSLNIEEDPLASLLMVDVYALLSRQFKWLLLLYDCLDSSKNLHLLPNFALSVALASKFLADAGEELPGDRDPDSLLQDALILFPGFVSRLLRRTSLGSVTNLDRSVLFGKEVQREPESLGRLLDLYVARTHHFWTTPSVQVWMETNIEIVLSLVEPAKHPDVKTNVKSQDPRFEEYSIKRQTCFPSLPLNVLRHLVLSEITEAPPIIPPNLRDVRIYNFDPFPPKNSLNICDPEEERRRQQGQAQRNILSAFISSLLPNYTIHQTAGAANVAEGPEDETGGARLASALEQLAASVRRILDFPRDEDINDNNQNVSDTEQ